MLYLGSLNLLRGISQWESLRAAFLVLFLLYINDLLAASSLFRYILFADDTNIFASGKDRGNLLRGLNSELGKLSDWFAHNKLTLNYDKTEFVNFSKPTAGSSEDKCDLKIE